MKLKKANGRPTKYSPDVALAIAEKVSYGRSLVVAAYANGVNPSTLTRWIKRGRIDLKAGSPTELAALAALVAEAQGPIRDARYRQAARILRERNRTGNGFGEGFCG